MTIEIGARAEWGGLRHVLVHPPGSAETLIALLHPEANLYEDIFSIIDARREHENFQNELREDGVKVSLLEDALKQNQNLRNEAIEFVDYRRHDGLEFTKQEKDTNRKLLGRIFSELDLAVIPQILFFSPTVKLECVGKKSDGSNKYEKVEDSFNALSNLYFTRDQQICTDKGIVIGRMAKSLRRDEPEVTKLAFGGLNVAPVYEIKKGCLEGGDFIPAKDFAIIGYADRTNPPAVEELLASGALDFDEVAVVEGVYNQDQMHLDTWFNIAGDGLAVARRDTFNSSKRKTTIYEKNNGTYLPRKVAGKIDIVPFNEYIRKEKGYEVFMVTPEEQKAYAINFLTLRDRKIMGAESAKPAFSKLQKEYGLELLLLNLSNLIKGYGGPHCMTCPIYRQS